MGSRVVGCSGLTAQAEQLLLGSGPGYHLHNCVASGKLFNLSGLLFPPLLFKCNKIYNIVDCII